MKNRFEALLKGGDLRSIGQSNKVVALADNQERFDELFENLFHSDRVVVMRAADAVEKISARHAGYLQPHKAGILRLCQEAKHKELKWHVAQIVSRLVLSKKEMDKVWLTLKNRATDKDESSIVRVNSLQALADLLVQDGTRKQDFCLALSEIETENIPSLTARIKKIKNTCR